MQLDGAQICARFHRRKRPFNDSMERGHAAGHCERRLPPRELVATLEVCVGGAHAMCVTEADKVNADLLAFING